MDLYETEEAFRKSVTKVRHKKTPLQWEHILDKLVVRVRTRSKRGTSALHDIETPQFRNRIEMTDGIEVVAFNLPFFC